MKKILLVTLAILTAAPALASSRVFTERENYTATEFGCLYASSCSASELKNKATAECYNAGYTSCTTLEANVVRTSFLENGICGSEQRGYCIARVLGTK